MKLDIDGTGVTVKFQSQTFKVALFCVRKKGGEQDAEDAELDPLRERSRRIGADLGGQLRQVHVGMDMDVDREDGNNASNTGIPECESGPTAETIPAPDSPPLSAQLPAPRVRSGRPRIWNPLLIKRVSRMRFLGRTGPSAMS